MNEKFLKPYNPAETEEKIYKKWEESGFFNPDNLPERHKKPFSIVMPPPNANGDLHVGHALFITLEDIITRYKRMRGYKALWIPGADHAGFETQIVYEKKLEKEGRSRFKMDPKDLYNEIYSFTIENKAKMENQVRRMGASCDWSREQFTLDPSVVSKVQKTFKKMFDDDLVYRGNRIINWCTKHQTSLSDVETETKESTDKLYYLKYGPLVVATVRPETMFGDVAVAVNPKDKRYQRLVGTTIKAETPIGAMDLKVIGDDAVDIEFGTGALKITPAHDKNDFEIGLRHALPSVEVIDKFGKLNEKTGKYAGLKIAEARKQVVEDLTSLGLIEKIEDYTHDVPTCFKCNTIIEPRQMPQWFVKMKPLADLALKAVEEKRIEFTPDNYQKIFTYWMSNTIDWNISRQIVWGIPIPAKICDKCGHGFPDLEKTAIACPKCGGDIHDDQDTFDTWFSSGQWPLIVLDYPDGKDFKEFYPTDVMETGYDLIFKWIPRMVIFGLYLAKDVPFRKVYLHGLVNDAKGKKMSKSKGNVMNPLDMTAKYGTDAMRIGLVIGNTPGTDLALSEDRIRGYKNFANKIWNATRFVLENTNGMPLAEKPAIASTDQKYLDEFSATLADVTSDMENYRFYLAGEKLYHYFWHTYADILIEASKKRISEGSDADKISAQWTLIYILENSLKALHPFMPFVTEEIWSLLPRSAKAPQGAAEETDNLLMIESWPIS